MPFKVEPERKQTHQPHPTHKGDSNSTDWCSVCGLGWTNSQIESRCKGRRKSNMTTTYESELEKRVKELEEENKILEAKIEDYKMTLVSCEEERRSTLSTIFNLSQSVQALTKEVLKREREQEQFTPKYPFDRAKMKKSRKLRERWNYWRARIVCWWLNLGWEAQQSNGMFDYYSPNYFRGKETCLRYFLASPDCENGIVWSVYQCGCPKNHDYGCSWRGDLPGGLIWSTK